MSANADAYVKLAGANPDLASSPVLLETIFDEDQVDRILDERKKVAAGSRLDALVASARTPAPTQEVVTDGGAG